MKPCFFPFCHQGVDPLLEVPNVAPPVASESLLPFPDRPPGSGGLPIRFPPLSPFFFPFPSLTRVGLCMHLGQPPRPPFSLVTWKLWALLCFLLESEHPRIATLGRFPFSLLMQSCRLEKTTVCPSFRLVGLTPFPQPRGASAPPGTPFLGGFLPLFAFRLVSIRRYFFLRVSFLFPNARIPLMAFRGSLFTFFLTPPALPVNQTEDPLPLVPPKALL